jgi:hypothetical protein
MTRSGSEADVARFGPFRRVKFGVLIVLLCAACNPAHGCAESDFDLAPESRLPKWFTLAPEQSRSGATVKMTYYIGLLGGSTARFVLRDHNGRQLAEVEGRIRDSQPQTLVPDPGTGSLPYPNYAIVTIDGITEVIEHRERGTVFYITDDPEVRRRLGVTG